MRAAAVDGMRGGFERPSDRALWQRCATGDHDAFGQLFDLHAAAVYNHLFRRTADWSEAEDLTSAVFLHAWRRRREVVFDRDSVLPWLLGVANHTLRNARRASARYQAAIDRFAAHAAEAAAGPADSIAERLDAERAMAGLRQAIDRLPRHEREVIELCVWSGLDQQAAATALGVAVGTVKSRLHRAPPPSRRLPAASTASTLRADFRERHVMDDIDPLNRLPRPPANRRLPGQERRREELMTAIRATSRRSPLSARRVIPLGSAAAVAGIVAAAVIVTPHLFGVSPQAGPHPGGLHPGGAGRHHASTTPLHGSRGRAHYSHGQWRRTDVLRVTAPVRALAVSAGTGAITVTGTSRSTASITEYVSYRGNPPHLSSQRAGDRLALTATCPAGSSCGVSCVIAVPRAASVTARVATGTVRLAALDGPLVARTGTGSISGTDLSARVVQLSSQTGSISAAFSVAPDQVRASTGTGAIRIQLPSATYAVTAHVGTGAVRVTVPHAAGSAHIVSARTGTGSIAIIPG